MLSRRHPRWHRDSLAQRPLSPSDPSTSVKSAAASKSSILFVLIYFRTLLRSPNSQPPSFQSFARSLHKTPGGGGPPIFHFHFSIFPGFSPLVTRHSPLSSLECAVEHPMKDVSPEGVSRPKDLSASVTPLECGVTRFRPLTPLECAVTKAIFALTQ